MRVARILLVDDHELFRAGLAELINAQPDLEVVGQADDGLEALVQARDLEPDLILMDITMPVCDGLEAARLIRERQPAARILMLTVHDEEEKLFEAIRSGACGYLLKSVNSAEFLIGVRSAVAGEAPVSPRLAARLLDEFVRLSDRPPAASDEPEAILTSREKEVLERIAAGAADKEIAEQLTISLHTVKSHVRNILSKLQAVNRHQAAQLATQQGLIRPTDGGGKEPPESPE